MHKFIIIFLLFLCACVTEKKRLKICKSCALKDSVVIKITEKIKEVTIHDTLQIRFFLPSPCAEMCDSLGRIKKGFEKELITDKVTRAVLKEDKGNLVISTGLNGIKIKAAVRDTCLSHYIETPARCEQEHRTSFDGWCRWWFYITLCLLLVGLALKYFRGKIF